MWTTLKTPSARPSTTKITIAPPSPIPGPVSSSTSVNIPSSTSKGQHEDNSPKKGQNDWSWDQKEHYDITTLPLTTMVPIDHSNKRLPSCKYFWYEYLNDVH